MPLRFNCFLPLLLGFLLLSAAQAANLVIDASSPTGGYTISWTGFEGSLCFGGSGVDTCATSGTITVTTPTGPINFSGSWISNGGSGGGTTLYFVDPGTNHVRDSMPLSSDFTPGTPGVCNNFGFAGCGTISGSFSTDVPTDLNTVPSGFTGIQITGAPQGLPPLVTVPANITFQFIGQLVTSGPLGNIGTTTNPAGGTLTTVNPTIREAVNTATGNTYIKFSDLIVPGPGPRFGFIRSYNDEDPYSGPLCRGWTHSYNILLTADATTGAVTIKEGDGHQNVFQPGTGSSYTAPTGVYDVLVNTGANTYNLTRPDQTVLAFGPISLTPLIVRLLSITDKNGNAQLLAYDLSGNLTTFTDIGPRTFTFSYDANNHLTSMNDTAATRTYAYSCAGVNLASYTDSVGQTSQYTYTNNLLTTAVDPRSNTAVGNTFDSQQRVTQTTRVVGPTSCVTSYAYDDVNHITTITDPLANVTKHYYDTSLRLIKILNALGGQTTFTYDSSNNLLSATNPLGKTTNYTYDPRGNRITVKNPLLQITQLSYDGRNNLLSEIDANGNSTGFGYDPNGNLTSVTDALGGVTHFSYDAKGNRMSFVNAKGKVTNYTYNLNNRVLTITDPTGKATLFTYDGDGRTASQKDPATNSRAFAYDMLGRLTTVTYDAATSGLASVGPVTYTYDANGNRLTMNDSSGTTTYTYDAENRVTSIVFPDLRTVSYTYDCNSNRKSITYAGKTVNYNYDALNRLVAVIDGASITNYTYDAADNVLSIRYPNGASVGYTYDGAGRITQVKNSYTGSTGAPISSYSYGLDNIGTRLRVTAGDGAVSAFTYDRLYRLLNSTGGKAASYTYDAVGNRITQNGPNLSLAYNYDDADRLTAVGSTPYVYDANGNQKTAGSGTAAVSYSFDAANRLIGVSGGGGLTSSFTYDGDGNRIGQKVGTGVYTYLNDIATGFSTVLQETGPDGTITYVRGRDKISEAGSGFKYYYQFDGQSTVAGVTDATGHLAERYTFDVWGNRQLSVPNPGIGNQNKFLYTGEAADPGTSLYFLRSRYYDSTLGRFISRDTFAGFDKLSQTLNRYTYVRNNPATLTDRTGYDDDGFGADFSALWSDTGAGYSDGSGGWSDTGGGWPSAPALP